MLKIKSLLNFKMHSGHKRAIWDKVFARVIFARSMTCRILPFSGKPETFEIPSFFWLLGNCCRCMQLDWVSVNVLIKPNRSTIVIWPSWKNNVTRLSHSPSMIAIERNVESLPLTSKKNLTPYYPGFLIIANMVMAVMGVDDLSYFAFFKKTRNLWNPKFFFKSLGNSCRWMQLDWLGVYVLI